MKSHAELALGTGNWNSLGNAQVSCRKRRLIVDCDRPSEAALRALSRRVEPNLAWSSEIWSTRIRMLLSQRSSWQGPIRYLSFRDGEDTLVGLFPYGTQRKGPISFVSLAGLFYPHRSVAVCSDEIGRVSRSLVEELTASRTASGLRLGPVLKDDRFIVAMLGELRERGWIIHEGASVSRMCVELPETVEAYRQQLSRKKLKELARKERKFLRECDGSEIREYTQENCSDWAAVIDEMNTVEHASWLPARGGDLHFQNELNRDIWMEMLGSGMAGLVPRVFVAYANGRPVAFNLGLSAGNIFHVVIGHYDEEYGPHALGHILDFKQLNAAIGDGASQADFGCGDSGYKRSMWHATATMQQCDYFALPPGLTGRAIAAGIRCYEALPGIRERIAGWRQRFGISAGRTL